MYAGYQAYSSKAAEGPAMEYMSMPHSRAAMLHMRPKVNDTLVSNLREPILTLVEDTSPGIHDTLMAACDPPRYKGLGVENWQEHGSCAENLVLALSEINERAGLKGPKGVGADVSINSVPAPLNLFMNIPWNDAGDISFDPPKTKAGDYVRLKAERDVVVVMSACPQDILDINNKEPTDAHFLVEGEEDTAPAMKRTQARKRPPPRKISSSHATSTVGSQSGAQPAKKPVPQRRTAPAKKPAGTTPAQPAKAAQSTQSKQVPQAKSSQAKPSQAELGQKKNVPKKVVPNKQGSAAQSRSTSIANGSTTPTPTPTEKKKPRKLNPKPNPAAQTET